MTSDQNLIFRLARQAIGLTTAEAAQLVYVTRRTFEMWESGERKIPTAKLELFLAKLDGKHSSENELLVIFSDDQSPLDVVARDTFLSISDVVNGLATISSMAVNRITGRPYVHRTQFSIKPHNQHIMDQASLWKSALSD
jgi:transcriptional regulator with XRE-family HTH domain